MEEKKLPFISFYFSESVLFNELRAKEMEKFFLASNSRSGCGRSLQNRADPFLHADPPCGLYSDQEKVMISYISEERKRNSTPRGAAAFAARGAWGGRTCQWRQWNRGSRVSRPGNDPRQPRGERRGLEGAGRRQVAK
jgi:hypothetical protein